MSSKNNKENKRGSIPTGRSPPGLENAHLNTRYTPNSSSSMQPRDDSYFNNQNIYGLQNHNNNNQQYQQQQHLQHSYHMGFHSGNTDSASVPSIWSDQSISSLQNSNNNSSSIQLPSNFSSYEQSNPYQSLSNTRSAVEVDAIFDDVALIDSILAEAGVKSNSNTSNNNLSSTSNNNNETHYQSTWDGASSHLASIDRPSSLDPLPSNDYYHDSSNQPYFFIPRLDSKHNSFHWSSNSNNHDYGNQDQDSLYGDDPEVQLGLGFLSPLTSPIPVNISLPKTPSNQPDPQGHLRLSESSSEIAPSNIFSRSKGISATSASSKTMDISKRSETKKITTNPTKSSHSNPLQLHQEAKTHSKQEDSHTKSQSRPAAPLQTINLAKSPPSQGLHASKPIKPQLNSGNKKSDHEHSSLQPTARNIPIVVPTKGSKHAINQPLRQTHVDGNESTTTGVEATKTSPTLHPTQNRSTTHIKLEGKNDSHIQEATAKNSQTIASATPLQMKKVADTYSSHAAKANLISKDKSPSTDTKSPVSAAVKNDNKKANQSPISPIPAVTLPTPRKNNVSQISSSQYSPAVKITPQSVPVQATISPIATPIPEVEKTTPTKIEEVNKPVKVTRDDKKSKTATKELEKFEQILSPVNENHNSSKNENYDETENAASIDDKSTLSKKESMESFFKGQSQDASKLQVEPIQIDTKVNELDAATKESETSINSIEISAPVPSIIDVDAKPRSRTQISELEKENLIDIVPSKSTITQTHQQEKAKVEPRERSDTPTSATTHKAHKSTPIDTKKVLSLAARLEQQRSKLSNASDVQTSEQMDATIQSPKNSSEKQQQQQNERTNGTYPISLLLSTRDKCGNLSTKAKIHAQELAKNIKIGVNSYSKYMWVRPISIKSLIADIREFVIDIHRTALSCLKRDTSIPFCFIYVRLFPIIIEAILPRYPPWGPVCLWYAFLFQFLTASGVSEIRSTFFYLAIPISFVLEGVSNVSFLLDLTGSELLIVAYILVMLRTQATPTVISLLSFSAQVFWAAAAGDSIFAQYIQLLLTLISISALVPPNSPVIMPSSNTSTSGSGQHHQSRRHQVDRRHN